MTLFAVVTIIATQVLKQHVIVDTVAVCWLSRYSLWRIASLT